jgi:serine/threonine protein kinase
VKQPTPFGKYLLLERISAGSMAEVFCAKAFGGEGGERLVAVKRILPDVAEDNAVIRMFIEDAKVGAQLNHAGIAQIFDLGVVDGAYYVAREHVHGRDLGAIFDRCRQLGEAMPVAQACFVAMKVCEALDYAHNKRDRSGRELALVHRAISPQNILLSFDGEVKLTDFGIAKVTGPARSHGGNLQRKLGYLSPEQVRGLPIDRRSDVFSSSIVLYELLTGERLFASQSDVSTLEKVRNVELLPPSTYNRKIPDELERIVLKALTKDVGERYQNAIDLHDELQAFVYTAGELYARENLAGWMKQTFGKEIEAEAATLESYRQLRPPAPGQPMPQVPRPGAATRPAGKRTAAPSISAAKPPPPPPPPVIARSQPVPVLPISASLPVQAQDPVPARASAATSDQVAHPCNPTALGWEDDELKTRVYDQDNDDQARTSPARAGLPLQPPVPPARAVSHVAGEPSGAGASELPSLVPNDAPRGAGAAASVTTPAMSPAWSGSLGARPRVPPDAMITRRRTADRRSILLVAIGGAAIVAITVIVVLLVSGGSRSIPRTAPQPPITPQPPVAIADPSTGFDLYVTPAGITQWKLDGEARTDRLPSRIRGIAAGMHTVQIDPPPGFLSQSQQVAVELGKAPRIEVTLQPVAGIFGLFDSSPPGAMVSLIIDGKRQAVGPSPAKAPLDARNTYHVLFEKPGYVSVHRPILLSGGLEERIVVNLEKASPAHLGAGSPGNIEPRPQRKVSRPAPEQAAPEMAAATKPSKRDASPPDRAARATPSPEGKPLPGAVAIPGKGQGVLVLGSKPPCEITIDGNATGLHTPQIEIKLAVGRHRITLANREFGIKETFTVDIKADTPRKMIKDYSDRLPD